MDTFINPRMITWARERSGLSVADLADKMKRDVIEIESWEDGSKKISYSILEQLAYRYLKIPLAVFFFPEPPPIDDPVNKFRRLPEVELEKLSPDTYKKVRLAQSYQDSLYFLLSETKQPKSIIHKLSPKDYDPIKFAQIVRRHLGMSLEKQYSFISSEEAFKAWRQVLEKAGIYTFKDSLEDKFISGFSLIDEEYPIILINNSNAFPRQVFTLIHELAHILYGVSGVTDFDESFIDMMEEEQKDLEINCNKFAAHFLVPDTVFIDDLSFFKTTGVESISKIAAKYSVSREVILRRLLDYGAVSRDFYKRKSLEWNKEYINRRKQSEGGHFYYTRLAYLGTGFTQIAFENHALGRISIAELGQHLNTNSKNLKKLKYYMEQ